MKIALDLVTDLWNQPQLMCNWTSNSVHQVLVDRYLVSRGKARGRGCTSDADCRPIHQRYLTIILDWWFTDTLPTLTTDAIVTGCCLICRWTFDRFFRSTNIKHCFTWVINQLTLNWLLTDTRPISCLVTGCQLQQFHKIISIPPPRHHSRDTHLKIHKYLPWSQL